MATLKFTLGNAISHATLCNAATACRIPPARQYILYSRFIVVETIVTNLPVTRTTTRTRQPVQRPGRKIENVQ